MLPLIAKFRTVNWDTILDEIKRFNYLGLPLLAKI